MVKESERTIDWAGHVFYERAWKSWIVDTKLREINGNREEGLSVIRIAY